MIEKIKKIQFTICLVFLLVLGNYPVFAYVMQSNNYRIQSDSLNIGGVRQTSNGYIMEDSIGEIATGPATSSNYKLKAGYQQMQETYLSISQPNNVDMGSISGMTGGVATGEAAWTVITDNPAGYSLKVVASTSPALQGQVKRDEFADYAAVNAATPDYNWGGATAPNVADSTAYFGFSPEGSHIVQKFKDNGVDACDTGINDTSDKCWYCFSVGDQTIANSYSSNHPSGTATTVKLKAQLYNEDGVPNDAAGMLIEDNYQATITATATEN